MTTFASTTAAELISRLPGPVSPQWPEGARSVTGLAHGTMSVKLFAPVGVDRQAPHAQDEVYLIIAGRGTFVVEGERHAFAPGTALFVRAGAVHRFEDFSDDFATWVVFWGPPGGEAP